MKVYLICVGVLWLGGLIGIIRDDSFGKSSPLDRLWTVLAVIVGGLPACALGVLIVFFFLCHNYDSACIWIQD